MQMKSLGMGLIALALVSSQVGCKKLAEKVARQAIESASEAASGSGEAGQAEDHPEEEVLSQLIGCMNGLDDQISGSLQQYASWLPADKDGNISAPTGKERSARHLREPTESRIKDCRDAIAASKGSQFEAPAAAYGAALDKLLPIHEKAYKYYDHEEWKDDKFAGAIAMHPELNAGFMAFHAASQGLHKAVSDANDARQRAQRDRLEKEEGKKIAWHRVNVMLLAKDAMRIATEDEPKLAELEAVTSAYEKSVDDFTAYLKANPEEASELRMASMLTNEMDSFVKALKDRVRRVRDKTPYGRHDTMSGLTAVSGSPGKVSYEYNELVSRSNQF